MTPRRVWLPLLVLLVALLLRFALLAFVETNNPSGQLSQTDSAQYLHIAETFLSSGTFAGESNAQPNTPILLRTPGYPGFIAAVYMLRMHERAAVILVQILLSAITILLLYHTVKLVTQREGLAFLAALLIAFDPLSLWASQVVLTESVFTLFVVLAVYIGVRITGARHALLWAAVGGASIGISALIRPVSYYLALPYAVALAIAAYQSCRRKARIFALILVTVVAWASIVFPWQWRNHVELQAWQLSAIGDYNLLFYRAAGIVAERDGIALEKAQQQLAEGLSPNDAPAKFYQSCREKALTVILAHLPNFASITARGALRMCFGPGTETVGSLLGLPPSRFLMASLLSWIGALWMLIIIGFRRSVRLPFFVPIVIFAYFVAVSSGPEAYARFRAPLMPILAIFAVNGCGVIYDRLPRLKTPVSKTSCAEALV